MKLSGDEKEIRQLFREMSDGDRLFVPGFERVVRGKPLAAHHGRAVRIWAWAVAMIVIATLALAIVVERQQRTAKPAEIAGKDSREVAPPPKDVAPAVNPLQQTVVPPRRVTAKHVRRHRSVADDLALAVKLSAWRSPTASLLGMRDDSALMSLPRLGDSLQTIKSYSVDQFE